MMTSKLHFDRGDPTSPENAADILISWMDENDKLYLLMLDSGEWPDTPEYRESRIMGINPGYFIHHGLMMDVRNGWLHGRKVAPPIVDFCIREYGLKHPDDVSGLIQYVLFKKLKGEPYDIAEKAERTRANYRGRGMEPLTWGDGPSGDNYAAEFDPGDAPRPPRRRHGRYGVEAHRKRGPLHRVMDWIRNA